MRVYSVNLVYQSKGSKTPGIDGKIIAAENRLECLSLLTYNSLLKYKASCIRRVFISKGKGKLRPLGILTIADRLVQTLFVLVLNPIIDVHSDIYSFGYRRGRNAHQAIGELSKILYTKPINKRKSSSDGKRRYFSRTKYVIITDIKCFFDTVDHS